MPARSNLFGTRIRSPLSGPAGEPAHISYKRNRFSARFPASYRYTRSHFWLSEATAGLWRIGLTTFATRMLGDIVEFDFETNAGARVQVADVIGWVEGFKAVSDIFCVAEGSFAGPNPALAEDPATIGSKPYGDGWLYAVEGRPDPEAVDIQGYVEHLDATIDKMLEKPWQTPGMGDS